MTTSEFAKYYADAKGITLKRDDEPPHPKEAAPHRSPVSSRIVLADGLPDFPP